MQYQSDEIKVFIGSNAVLLVTMTLSAEVSVPPCNLSLLELICVLAMNVVSSKQVTDLMFTHFKKRPVLTELRALGN